jgi:hypothetical protein
LLSLFSTLGEGMMPPSEAPRYIVVRALFTNHVELQNLTGAGDGTVRNKLSKLMQGGTVIADDGRPKTYSLVEEKVSLSSHLYRGSDSDDTNNSTVSGLFANPPGWLTMQLKVYRENPSLHFKPLCAAVAAAVLGEPGRGYEVADEVRKEVG